MPCVCGSSKIKPWIENTIRIVECMDCGVRRVHEPNIDSYLHRYTSGSYHAEDRTSDTGHKAHPERFEHDYNVAVMRLKKLERFNCHEYYPRVLLDVGCSNAALVKAARDKDYEAYGCDLSTDAVHESVRDFVYVGSMEKCRKRNSEPAFHRRTLDVIMFNDVLEHIPDPRKAIRTAGGLLNREGILVVEVPDVKDTSSKHIKPHEHLWYFTGTQLREFLEREDFNVVWMDAPIPGKITAYAMPSMKVTDVTVYGPPGIGDIMWTLNKIPGIREREYPCRINYIVCVDGQLKIATRAKDFLGLCKYIDSFEFKPLTLPRNIGNVDPAEPVYELFANDWLEPQCGLIENWRPELPSSWDWDIGIKVPFSAENQVYARLGGHSAADLKYVAIYMSSHVWNRAATMPDWTPKHWAETIIGLNAAELKPVILGAGWDTDYAKEVAAEIVKLGKDPARTWINMIGKTPLPLAMAWMKLAKMTIGICAGLPMIAAHMGWPTQIFWPQAEKSNTILRFTPQFAYNWVPPQYRHTTYFHRAIGTFTPSELVKDILNQLEGEQQV